MKKLLAILMVASTMLMAISDTTVLPTNEKKLLNSLVDKLSIPDNISAASKKKIYSVMDDFLEKDWSTHWMTNTSVKGSKIKNSNTQIVDLMIYNNDRVTNLTFVYFGKLHQLFVTTKQYIEVKSSLAMKYYKARKKNKEKYDMEDEGDNYAYFQKKGYISYSGYHIVKPVGLVIYESSNIYNITFDK